nr:PREDICTED: dual specificity protein phosphatase 22 isoform X3 [Latimeria chalumnae]|eukprot:XP_005995154.1 PREDICTED: dual specificity protein phosphatase 22 isoform X3 [Latimeria chalumnae]
MRCSSFFSLSIFRLFFHFLMMRGMLGTENNWAKIMLPTSFQFMMQPALCWRKRPTFVFLQLTHLHRTCKTKHFKESIKFIHECRLRDEGCLVHCLAGVSRSVTLVVAYMMTTTGFGWEDALCAVKAARSCANPNAGFQRQLQEFEDTDVNNLRLWLKEEYGDSPFQDAEEAGKLLAKYKEQQAEAQTSGNAWNSNYLTSVPNRSYSNYTTET